MKMFFASLIFLLTTAANAQTVILSDNFTFGPGTTCSSITAWNGNPNAYPGDMGAICLSQGDPEGGGGSYLDVPWQFGFLNNGYLAGCDSIAWGTKNFTIGNGTHVGDAYTVAGTTTCPYYTGEYGGASDNEAVGFNVTASYVIGTKCNYYRGRCVPYLVNVLQGGSGTVVETLIN